MLSAACEQWNERGGKSIDPFYDSGYGDADWDETTLAIRVDCIEGDEGVFKNNEDNRGDRRFVYGYQL